jgi:hypothetical protein
LSSLLKTCLTMIGKSYSKSGICKVQFSFFHHANTTLQETVQQ